MAIQSTTVVEASTLYKTLPHYPTSRLVCFNGDTRSGFLDETAFTIADIID